jgi:hypothetical protein
VSKVFLAAAFLLGSLSDAPLLNGGRSLLSLPTLLLLGS